MSTKHQYIILTKCIYLAYFIAKVFGFWLYSTEPLNHKIKYNIFRVIYSILFSIFLLCGYLALGKNFLYASNKKLFVSFAFQSVFFFNTYMILISYVCLYVGQYLQFKKRQCAYVKCKEVLDLLKSYQLKLFDIKKYLVLFFIKTIVVDAFILFSMSMAWNMIGSSQSYLLAFTYLPIVIVRFYTNLFYGGILIIEVIFKQLNTNLDGILNKARLLSNTNNGKSKLYFKRKYGELSDELDTLSIVYAKVLQATKAFNSVFTSQIPFWIIAELLLLVMRCFYQYIAFVGLLTKNSNSSFVRIIRINVVIFLTIFDLVSTSGACDSLVTQARETMNILHAVQFDSNLGRKFKKSIDIFSTQILLYNLKFTQCGMFDLNLNTVHSVLSAVASYAIMVIQFELAGNR